MDREVPDGYPRDDRILPLTRIVLVVVVPFLVAAFIILYFYPEQSGGHFAWAINPPMSALFIGAGYLGGGYQFVRLIAGKKWHHYGMAFPPVSTFTVAMMAATVVHWDRFDIHHLPFQLWLILYIVTPFLVTWLWVNNRRTDPIAPEAGDPLLPRSVNLIFRVLGVLVLCAALLVFVKPQVAIDVWSWKLTPLTARILAGWFALMGVGSLVLGVERRWSACRVALQSFLLWHGLVLLGACLHRSDLGERGLANGYVFATLLGLAGMIALYIYMEARRRQVTATSASGA
jgi:hypothetical protein